MPRFVTRRPNNHHHSISKKSNCLETHPAIIPPRVLTRMGVALAQGQWMNAAEVLGLIARFVTGAAVGSLMAPRPRCPSTALGVARGSGAASPSACVVLT
jgi:hypothetical protein